MERKNFSCTFSMHSCSWLVMKSFLLEAHEISCESQFHKKKNSRKLFMPSQLQECMEKVQLKFFLSNLLLLLPFLCLTHCTVGHSTEMTMLEYDDPLSLPLLSLWQHCSCVHCCCWLEMSLLKAINPRIFEGLEQANKGCCCNVTNLAKFCMQFAADYTNFELKMSRVFRDICCGSGGREFF